MMRMDGDYEDVTMYTLDADVEERLLLAHNECTFIWSNREGWPVGVIMSYVWRRGAFWLTASGQRARVAAVRRDPRVCVVVTSTGSPLPRNKAVTWKGRCTVHDDQAIKDWFYGELATALNPGASGVGRPVPQLPRLPAPCGVRGHADPTHRLRRRQDAHRDGRTSCPANHDRIGRGAKRWAVRIGARQPVEVHAPRR